MAYNWCHFSIAILWHIYTIDCLMFRSYLVPDQWDTWAFYNEPDNTYYAYYLIRDVPNYKGEGFGLATSSDTVHWIDYGYVWHNPWQNTSWEGTGTIWLNPYQNESFKYIVNFSNQPFGKSYQNISFAVSKDLIHWESDINTIGWFQINTKYYKDPGRWDTIYLFKGNNNEMYGAWTATPNSKYNNNTSKSIWGFGKTEDGLNWIALPPPQIIYDQIIPPANNGELGAIERFIINNGSVIYVSMVGMNGKMWAYISNKPEGPYYPNIKNFLILSGNCYYARFFRGIEDNNLVLITHQSMSNYQQFNRPITFIAPYKYADIDNKGVFRMKYWIGNENMKGNKLNISYMINSNDTLIDYSYINAIKGLFIEGIIDFSVSDNVGIRIGLINDKFTCINVNRNGTAALLMAMNSNVNNCQNANNLFIDRGVMFPINSEFKLLLRYSMFEFYVDDILYFVNKLNVNQSGIIGKVIDSKQYVQFIDVFSMDLYVNKTIYDF